MAATLDCDRCGAYEGAEQRLGQPCSRARHPWFRRGLALQVCGCLLSQGFLHFLDAACMRPWPVPIRSCPDPVLWDAEGQMQDGAGWCRMVQDARGSALLPKPSWVPRNEALMDKPRRRSAKRRPPTAAEGSQGDGQQGCDPSQRLCVSRRMGRVGEAQLGLPFGPSAALRGTQTQHDPQAGQLCQSFEALAEAPDGA